MRVGFEPVTYRLLAGRPTNYSTEPLLKIGQYPWNLINFSSDSLIRKVWNALNPQQCLYQEVVSNIAVANMIENNSPTNMFHVGDSNT